MANYAGTINQNARRNTSYKIPVGVVIPCISTSTLQAGYLYCDGSAQLIANYPQLYAILGTTYGNGTTTPSGSGSISSGFSLGTAFNLPDYRGRFLRGVNTMGTSAGSNGKNPDATGLGGVQGHAYQGHYHNVYGAQWYYATGGTISSYHGIYSVGGGLGLDTTGRAKGKNVQNDGASGNAKTSNETRPMNVSVMYMIRAG
jgi:microcystin-dependent protein